MTRATAFILALLTAVAFLPAPAAAASSSGSACAVSIVVSAECARSTIINDPPSCNWTGGGQWLCVIHWRLYLSVDTGATCGKASSTYTYALSVCSLGSVASTNTDGYSYHYPAYFTGSTVYASGEVCARISSVGSYTCATWSHPGVYLAPPPSNSNVNMANPLVHAPEIVDGALAIADGGVAFVGNGEPVKVDLIP
jgi:hypothetical protein